MSPLVIGLVCGLAVGAVVIFCCIRSVCKEKTAIERQVKQVHQVDEDPAYDDVEAPTPPSEQNTRRSTITTTTTRAPASSTSKAPAAVTVTKAAAPAPAPTATRAEAPVAAAARARRAKPKPKPTAADSAPPSYDDLEAAAAAANAGPTEHVYGDDEDPFKGVAEYQDAGDPYDAPVRVSRSTERRSGSLRSLSPEVQSRTSSLSSSRGRSEVRSAAAAAAIHATGGGQA